MSEKEEQKSRLPEAGRWPDRFTPIALIVGVIFVTVGFLMAFFYAAPVNGASLSEPVQVGDQMVTNVQLFSQKIFYFHMPVAIVSFAALIFAGYYSIRFLVSKQQRFDTCAHVAMEIALVFVICTMATGEMWTRFEWGVWWTWDPRLTTYLILMLIVIAYFILRSAVDDLHRRAVYDSVVAIIALVDVPICYMITRIIPSSLHPVVLREGGMTADMGITVGVVMIGMLALGFALYRMRFRQIRLTQKISSLQKRLEYE